MSALKRFFSSETTLATGLIVVIAAITYAVLIPWLGFYRDDWYFVWTAQAQGPAGVIDLFRIDRPFMGMLYAIEYPLIGLTPLAWHLFALVLKIIGALGFFWLLRTLWPERRLETAFIALIFVVYPGFLQQPNAATFQNHLFGYGAAILSIALSVKAAKSADRRGQILLHGAAMILAMVYLLIYEYMLGLEVARFVLITYAVWRPENGRGGNLREGIKRFVPYLLVTAAFLVWRIFIFKSTRRATSVAVLLGDYAATPLHSIAVLVMETAKSAIETALLAWAVPFYQLGADATYSALGAAVFVALIAVGLFAVYYRKWRGETQAPLDPRFAWLWMGALITLAALVPIVAAGRSVRFGLQWDRYTLQASIGVALLAGGFVSYLGSARFRLALMLLLIGLGVSTQYLSAARYADFWALERNMWWQLSWRAPGIKPNTVLVAVMPDGFRFAEEYEAFAPVNLIYYPRQDLQVDAQVLNSDTAIRILRGQSDDRTMRSIPIHRDYTKTLLVSLPFQYYACAHVVDGQNVTLPYNDDLLTRLVAGKSDVSRLTLDGPAAVPPAYVFGGEPAHGWCYYYQKMDLAAQLGDWEQVAQLGAEAQELDLQPHEVSEWMPLFRAYATLGDGEKSGRLIKLIKADRGFVTLYCNQILDRPDPAALQLCGSD